VRKGQEQKPYVRAARDQLRGHSMALKDELTNQSHRLRHPRKQITALHMNF